MSRQRLSRRESQVLTRMRLLDAAAEVFAEHGVAGASVERIADRAGYTRGAFYGHFADKDAVVAALLDERTRREREEVAQLAASEGDTWDALRSWHHERSVHLEEWLALRLELVRHTLRRPRGERSVLAEREAYAREALTGAVARELRTDTAEAAFTALIVHALEDGLAIQRAIDPDSVPPDAIVTATEIVLRGARPTATSDEFGGSSPST